MNKRLLGSFGEALVSNLLLRRGFRILHRNWTCQWGELDIVAAKGCILYFVEVKSAGKGAMLNAHENFTYVKIRHLRRTISIYLAGKKFDLDAFRDFRLLLFLVEKYGTGVEVVCHDVTERLGL